MFFARNAARKMNSTSSHVIHKNQCSNLINRQLKPTACATSAIHSRCFSNKVIYRYHPNSYLIRVPPKTALYRHSYRSGTRKSSPIESQPDCYANTSELSKLFSEVQLNQASSLYKKSNEIVIGGKKYDLGSLTTLVLENTAHSGLPIRIQIPWHEYIKGGLFLGFFGTDPTRIQIPWHEYIKGGILFGTFGGLFLGFLGTFEGLFLK